MLRASVNGKCEAVMIDPLEKGNDLDEGIESYFSPWKLYMRRKVGMMDAPYMHNLLPMNSVSNSWILS